MNVVYAVGAAFSFQNFYYSPNHWHFILCQFLCSLLSCWQKYSGTPKAV